MIGAVGCSLTQESVRSYHEAGGAKFWPTSRLDGYAGGDIADWAILGDSRWNVFQQAMDALGASGIWLQVCISGGRSDAAANAEDIADVEVVAAEIQRRAPGATIYVSALPDYQPMTLCPKKGLGGPGIARDLADHLVAAGTATRGPITGPLDTMTTTASSNNCGLDDAGRILVGGQLLGFFG
jgi:hypothetical protein